MYYTTGREGRQEVVEGLRADPKRSFGVDCIHESVGTSATRGNRFEIQEAAERLRVSAKQLALISIEEKLAQTEDKFRRSAGTRSTRMLTSIAGFPDALPISSGSHLATPTLNLTK